MTTSEIEAEREIRDKLGRDIYKSYVKMQQSHHRLECALRDEQARVETLRSELAAKGEEGDLSWIDTALDEAFGNDWAMAAPMRSMAITSLRKHAPASPAPAKGKIVDGWCNLFDGHPSCFFEAEDRAPVGMQVYRCRTTIYDPPAPAPVPCPTCGVTKPVAAGEAGT